MLIDIWKTSNRHIGRQVEVHDQLESTNTLALERSRDPASDSLALLAREQLAGRGQFGRSWLAPAGSSVLLSVVLFPPQSLRRPALLTAWAAVSVCELVRQLSGLEPVIKWPNDVLLIGKKVCGILIEQHGSGTVAGIGLNVCQDASFFASAQLPLAGSLLSLTGQTHDSGDVARQLLSQLDRLYAPLAEGETAALESMWRERLGLLGRDVKLDLGGMRHEGRLREIAFAGLLLELPRGEIMKFQPEAIRGISI